MRSKILKRIGDVRRPRTDFEARNAGLAKASPADFNNGYFKGLDHAADIVDEFYREQAANLGKQKSSSLVSRLYSKVFNLGKFVLGNKFGH